MGRYRLLGRLPNAYSIIFAIPSPSGSSLSAVAAAHARVYVSNQACLIDEAVGVLTIAPAENLASPILGISDILCLSQPLPPSKPRTPEHLLSLGSTASRRSINSVNLRMDHNGNHAADVPCLITSAVASCEVNH